MADEITFDAAEIDLLQSEGDRSGTDAPHDPQNRTPPRRRRGSMQW